MTERKLPAFERRRGANERGDGGSVGGGEGEDIYCGSTISGVQIYGERESVRKSTLRTEVLLHPLGIAALGDDRDSTLNVPGKQDSTDRFLVLLSERDDELLTEDGRVALAESYERNAQGQLGRGRDLGRRAGMNLKRTAVGGQVDPLFRAVREKLFLREVGVELNLCEENRQLSAYGEKGEVNEPG